MGAGRLGISSRKPSEWDDIQCVVKGTTTLRVKDQLHKSGNLNIQGRGGVICMSRLSHSRSRVQPRVILPPLDLMTWHDMSKVVCFFTCPNASYRFILTSRNWKWFLNRHPHSRRDRASASLFMVKREIRQFTSFFSSDLASSLNLHLLGSVKPERRATQLVEIQLKIHSGGSSRS